jgi:hypothetical protein
MPRYQIAIRDQLSPELQAMSDEMMDTLIDNLVAEGRVMKGSMGRLYQPRFPVMK